MKKLMLLAALATAGTASAAPPPQLSQHPRVGELAELDFAWGSADLARDYAHQLGEIAGWALANPDGLVVLDGHAIAGEHASPQGVVLSLQRAETVRDQLLAQGVDADHIVIAAFEDERTPQATGRVIAWGTHDSLEEVVSRLQRGHASQIKRGTLPNVASR
jgi:outer membrane protein OmpA-like peptidoglycan-associated protein